MKTSYLTCSFSTALHYGSLEDTYLRPCDQLTKHTLRIRITQLVPAIFTQSPEARKIRHLNHEKAERQHHSPRH
ncbi:hypothetical protein E2C01_052614 [Portunus trituberculatus]|uniref:Uncharacterized protein n=1 Tax=Portunus trituberculatus TaxID=210409 RepID=A0A5B7GMY7_PORTR|nr:hypothetical protein [Portunus trituberculatus]